MIKKIPLACKSGFHKESLCFWEWLPIYSLKQTQHKQEVSKGQAYREVYS